MLQLDQVKIDLLAAAATSAGTDVTGTGVDMSGYEGVIFFCTITTSNAANFLKAQQSDALASGYADLAGTKVVAANDGDIVALEIHKPAKRYVRPVIDRGGANTVTGEIYAIRYGARKLPVENAESGVLVEESHQTPDEGTA